MPSDRVPLGKSPVQDLPFVAAAVAGGLGAFFAAVAAVAGWQSVILFGALAAAAVAAPLAAVRAAALLRKRRWVTPTADGFILEDRRGTFEFADADVTDLGTWAKTRYSNGKPAAVVRNCHLTLRAGDAAADLTFEYEIALGGRDPLAGFLDRNLARLTVEADADLAAGGDLPGDGWVLTKNELTVRSGKNEAAHPVADLSAVDVFDGNVCVWVGDRADPAVKVPAGSPNALVLARVLDRAFSARPARPDDAAGGGLGRILFERDHSTSVTLLAVVTLVLAVLDVWALGFAAAWALAKPPDFTAAAVGLGAAVVLTGMIAAGWQSRRKVFRCHVRGVCLETTRGARRLMYEDMAGFTYSATRVYTNGTYNGTRFALTFEPRGDDRGDRIRYAGEFRNADDELDNLRDHVARVLAGVLLRRLQKGKAVDWTAGAVIRPDGLEIPAGGVFRKGEPKHLAYTDITGTNMQDGVFYLFARGEKKSVFQVAVSSPNFFPGFVLLAMILNPPEAS